jgi:hypothetical protein
LVAACDDPQLFNVNLWPGQRDILESVEPGEKRLFVLALGRRSGKTLMAALVMLWSCLLRPDLRGRWLAQGSGSIQWASPRT